MSNPERKDFSARPAFYAALMDGLYEVGQAHGYEICPHGSLQRDLDLVAVPWRERVATPDTLINAMRAHTGAALTPTGIKERPHRRLACTLTLAQGYFLDLSTIEPGT